MTTLADDEMTEMLAQLTTEIVAALLGDGVPDSEVSDRVQRISDGMWAYGAASRPGAMRAFAELLRQKLEQR